MIKVIGKPKTVIIAAANQFLGLRFDILLTKFIFYLQDLNNMWKSRLSKKS